MCKGDTYTIREEQPTETCKVRDTDSGAIIECPDGSSAVISDGRNGEDGNSCEAFQVENGAVIDCGDGQQILVKHGEDGVDGENGEDAPTTAYEIVEVIDPCGEESSYHEVLLVFANGEILAHYSIGNKQHLGLIGPGRYITTDNTNCIFTIAENGSVEW
jgi:hypothetical protein